MSTKLLDLDAYVTGELTGAAADAMEDAMFDAPDDADLVFLDRLSRRGQRLVDHGTWNTGVTKAHLDKLEADGHIVQICDAGPPGGTRAYTIRPDAEFLVTRLPLGRTDQTLVDVDVTIVAHNVTKTIKDVIVDQDGVVYGLCERPLAQLAFGAQTIVRVRENHGARTLIAEWNLFGDVGR